MGFGSLIEWTAPTSGTYFIRADNFAIETGSYTLHVDVQSFPDYLEDDDFIAQATPLVSGDQSWHQLTIDQPGDDDYFRLTAATDGTLEVDTLFVHGNGDIDLELLDSNGDVQASSTSATDNEHLVMSLVQGETYYIRVFGQGGAINPNYSLVIDAPGDVDLSGYDFDIRPDAMGLDRFGPGETVDVFFDIENLGNGAVAGINFEVGFYLSVDDVLDPATDWFVDRAFGQDLNPAMTPGAYFNDTVPVTLPDFTSPFWDMGSDTFYLGMYIDDLFSQSELSEDNNTLVDDFALIIPEDQLEQDDTILTATVYALGENVDVDGLTIDKVGDDDYFRVVPEASGPMDVMATFLHAQGNVDLEVLDDTDTVIATSSTLTDDEQLTVDVMAGRDYTIRVTSLTADTSLGYALTVELPDVLPDILPDAFEENDSFATATMLPSEDQTYPDLNIHTPTDEDYFHWVSEGVGQMTIELQFIHAMGGNVELFIYDSTMTPIADSQSADDNESVVLPDVMVGDELFIQVLTIPNNDSGVTLEAHPDYTLLIDAPPAPLTGDFNIDGKFDCADIDPLVAVSAANGYDENFDLNGDFRVNRTDVEIWLALAGAAPGSPTGGNPFLVGDADLNGNVDGQDYVTWNINKFTSNPSWCAGDFTADGNIDGQDFIAWNGNKFTSASGNTLVAPPTTGRDKTWDGSEAPTTSNDNATPTVPAWRPPATFARSLAVRELSRGPVEPTNSVVDLVFANSLKDRWGDQL